MRHLELLALGTLLSLTAIAAVLTLAGRPITLTP